MNYQRREVWTKLIVRLADGRKICNCGESYEVMCHDAGCSAGQINAKYEVGERLTRGLTEVCRLIGEKFP